MISLEGICKNYHTRHGVKEVLQDVHLQILNGEKIGILVGNVAGKSTLIRIVSGAEPPTRGNVKREMSISWPLAFGGAFQGSLTGLDNMRFICRIYGVDSAKAERYVADFSELGTYLREPVKTYSSGMRARLAFAISMAIDFDCFLIDEIVAVGDSRFHERCHIELFEKRKDRAMILVSHDATYIKAHCDTAAVLKNGRLYRFNNVDDALKFYQTEMTTPGDSH
jgi:capsular polysaccharide transport system ATP-binding protein